MLKSVSKYQFRKKWCKDNWVLTPIFGQAQFSYSGHDKHCGNKDVNIAFIHVNPYGFDPIWKSTSSHHLRKNLLVSSHKMFMISELKNN